MFEDSYDAMTGMRTRIGTQNDKLVVQYESDVEPALDYAQNLRNAPEYTAAGIKSNLMHCVHIPNSVILKIKTETGFDIYTQPAKAVRKFLAKNKDKYGRLFTTAGAF
jgi:hypothetical protein